MATTVGIRELKNNLSAYVRRSQAGEVIKITAHGRTVARLVPEHAPDLCGLDALIAEGLVRAPVTRGPIRFKSTLRLPPGTATALLDADRDETHRL